MYNTTQHLTVAWFYYWIKALGHVELCTVHVNVFLRCRLDRGKRDGVFMYVKQGCVNKEVMEREDAAWPCGNLVWLSEQSSTWGPYCVLRGKRGVWGRSLTKTEKSLWLRKRATKPANSWYSGKRYENNPSHTVRFSVPTLLLPSDVSPSNGTVCGGQPLTFDPSVWETMTAAANMSLLRRAEPAAAEQRLKLPLCQLGNHNFKFSRDLHEWKDMKEYVFSHVSVLVTGNVKPLWTSMIFGLDMEDRLPPTMTRLHGFILTKIQLLKV